MKKALSILLTAVMLLSLTAGLDFSAYADDLPSSGSCGENVTYTFDSSTGVLTISGAGAMTDYMVTSASPFNNNSNIKSVIIESKVTSIGSYAFYGCKKITNVILSDCVTSINNHAFRGCTYLATINIPESVEKIGAYAFYECLSLSIIDLHEGLKTIEQNAFQYCSSLSNILLPDSITELGVYSFSDCTKLTEINIPSGVTTIPQRAFNKCTSLESVYFPKNVKIIEAYAFFFCNIKNIIVEDLASWCQLKHPTEQFYPEYNYLDLFYEGEKVTTLIIPEGVTRINDGAFNGFNLSCVVLPEGLTYIGEESFANNRNLDTLVLPKSINEIEKQAFNNSNVKRIYYASDNEDWNDVYIAPNSFSKNDYEIIHNYIHNESHHIYDNGRIITPATCTNTGEKLLDCLICNATKNETIEKTAHKSIKDKSVPATFTKEGKTEGFHCSVCGAILVAQKPIAKLPKKTNTLKVKAKKPTVKFAKLKKKNQTINLKKAMTVSNAQGTVTYKLASAKKGKKNFKKYFKVAKNGKITVKKGLKKGTYKVKIQVSATGNTEYNAAVKTVTVTIKVK